jgi:hypothetical protein
MLHNIIMEQAKIYQFVESKEISETTKKLYKKYLKYIIVELNVTNEDDILNCEILKEVNRKNKDYI